MTDIAIVIVNYKSWDALSECLEALSAMETDRFSLETIVVDNCSNDGKYEAFTKRFPKIRFMENTGNNGFANGCNFGANAAHSDYLLFLNPDTVASEEAIHTLWQTAKNNPEFGIVTCTQVDAQDKKYKEIRFFPSLKTLFGPFRALNRIMNKKTVQGDFSNDKNIVFPDWATGAVIFMSKSWYQKINGWNEKYWLYFEDVDICKRVMDQGGRVALIRNASILHKHGGASRINIKTKALTKTEVLISQHVYFNEHTRGPKRIIIQFLLLFTLLLEKTLLAIAGLLFFFIPKLKVNLFIFRNLMRYYISAIGKGTWASPRAPLYSK